MIIDLNIRHYRDLLKGEADPAKRRTITANYQQLMNNPG
jgi:hypothetical protein